jgi:phosphatidylserine/phosphatidylglycerophosphate/cardiolipin synthase-like enzyme
MTVIGSSNYSYRSNRRDTECQLYIVSECEHIYKKTTKMSIETVKNDGTDKITWTERLFSNIFWLLL